MVSSQQSLTPASATSTIPLPSVSIDSLREDIVRKSDIIASKLHSDSVTQQRIDRLTVVSFFASAADLIRLLCRCEKRSIFSLLEATKYLSSSLHLNSSPSFACSSPAPHSSFAKAQLPHSLRNEYAVIAMLSEAAPEFLTILPSDEANGVSYPTVRVNPVAPMAEVREKLMAMSVSAAREREKLVGQLSSQ